MGHHVDDVPVNGRGAGLDEVTMLPDEVRGHLLDCLTAPERLPDALPALREAAAALPAEEPVR
ncbi:hypothetical protein [Actinokineospora iranica]|nr:hypothetical protein [Actinokineospora iranica]